MLLRRRLVRIFLFLLHPRVELVVLVLQRINNHLPAIEKDAKFEFGQPFSASICWEIPLPALQGELIAELHPPVPPLHQGLHLRRVDDGAVAVP